MGYAINSKITTNLEMEDIIIICASLTLYRDGNNTDPEIKDRINKLVPRLWRELGEVKTPTNSLNQTGLYKFHKDFGRMGEIEGVFIESAENVEVLIGTTVHFGEILGKHSDVSLTIESQHITLVTTDEKVIEVVEEHGLTSGINPFDYEH